MPTHACQHMHATISTCFSFGPIRLFISFYKRTPCLCSPNIRANVNWFMICLCASVWTIRSTRITTFQVNFRQPFFKFFILDSLKFGLRNFVSSSICVTSGRCDVGGKELNYTHRIRGIYSNLNSV